MFLSPRFSHGVSHGCELRHEHVTMIPLDFNDAVFHRTTGSAFFFQGCGHPFQSGFLHWNAADSAYAFPLSTFGRPPYPYYSIPFQMACGSAATASVRPLFACRTNTATFGGVHQFGVFVLHWHPFEKGIRPVQPLRALAGDGPDSHGRPLPAVRYMDRVQGSCRMDSHSFSSP